LISLERPAGAAGTVDATLDAAREGELRDHFERHNWVLVPGFLGPRLLDEIQRLVESTDFEHRADEMGGELKLGHQTAVVARMLFIVNDHAVHRAVEAATGNPRIARFDGRIYRREPVPEHYHVWHDDVVGEVRLVAMSVNLSEAPYEGGVLEMRRKGEAEPFASVHNTGPGDALMFRVHPDLEHCISDVTAGSKTSLAGWFGAAPPWPLRPEV
jgi:2OG-Fe(II) oxygenase superfamily